MSWTQLSDFHFHGKTLLLYTKTCFSSSGCITIPPVPNLASSNNKLLLCHGPVESRCGLPGSLTSGSFTGCCEGVGSGCSCLMAGVGQNSFPASLRGLLLRFSSSQAIRPMASILCWLLDIGPLGSLTHGQLHHGGSFLPSEGERDLI